MCNKIDYGRNLTLIRMPTFIKLVRVMGLPDVLRGALVFLIVAPVVQLTCRDAGEVWEVCCGAIHKRYFPTLCLPKPA